MRAVEFDSFVDGGVICIPEQYRHDIGNAVRVIVLSEDTPAEKTRPLSAEDFTEPKISTAGWKFDREEANGRR